MITGGNNISGFSTSPVQFRTPRSKARTTEKTSSVSSRFDTVTITGEGYDSFGKQLTGRITQEVRAAATPGRLNALSEQIASGEYKPDAMAIAKRMLLLSEES